MILFKFLYVSSIIFFQFFLVIDTKSSDQCDSMSLTSRLIEIPDETKGKKVEIKVSGGIAPFKYLFYKESGHLLKEDDFSLNTIIISEGGKYFCTVLDNKNCYKTIEFEIK